MATPQIDGTVYVMRHGRTALDIEHRSDGWLDLPLDAEGQLSVIPAQQHLKATRLQAIHAPPLKRTKETAEIMASGNIGEPDVTEAEDAKTWNLGILAGTRKRYGRPAVQRLVDNPSKAPPGGESYNEFRGRFLPWFKERCEEAIDGEPILIVCSGSNLRAIGKAYFGDEDLLDLDEGGLACLRHAGGDWHEEVLFGSKKSERKKRAGRVPGRASDLQDGALSAVEDSLSGDPIS